MTPGAIAVLSLSMSTDAFAAAVGRGASHRPNFAGAVRAGAVFGVIEAVTPVIGWGLGLVAAGLVERIDHWIAFVLLVAVGAKMIWEATRPQAADGGEPARRSGPWALVATAVGDQHRRGGGRRRSCIPGRQHLDHRAVDRPDDLRLDHDGHADRPRRRRAVRQGRRADRWTGADRIGISHSDRASNGLSAAQFLSTQACAFSAAALTLSAEAMNGTFSASTGMPVMDLSVAVSRLRVGDLRLSMHLRQRRLLRDQSAAVASA